MFFLVTSLLLAASEAKAAPPVAVVATLPTLAAIASEVGGPDVTVETLASPGEDPHFVEAKPNLIIRLNRAEIVILNGLELEIGWLPPLLTSARNGAIQPGTPGYFDASAHVRLVEVPTQKLDRSMGDVHPGGNPHFHFDPRAAAAIARALAKRFGELRPALAPVFTGRAAKAAEAWERFAQAERERFAKLPESKRLIVPYHRSFPYLFDWLGLKDVIEVEPKPGISPDPAHVAKVLGTMRAQHVHVIVQEEFYPQSTSKTLAQLADAHLIVLPGAAWFGQETYLEYIRRVSGALYDALDH